MRAIGGTLPTILAETSDKMINSTAFVRPMSADQPEIDRVSVGLEPLPGESPLWFNRFQMYRDLGYKRSLRLAVAMERQSVHLVKATDSPKNETDQTASTTSVPPVVGGRSETLPDKAVVRATQVPGSWKDASIRFLWQERASAYELYIIHKTSEHLAQKLQDTYANKAKRICALNEMIETASKNAQLALQHFPVEDAIKGHAVSLGYTKHMRALLADLRMETEGMTEQDWQESLERWSLAIRHREIDKMQKSSDERKC